MVCFWDPANVLIICPKQNLKYWRHLSLLDINVKVDQPLVVLHYKGSTVAQTGQKTSFIQGLWVM